MGKSKISREAKEFIWRLIHHYLQLLNFDCNNFILHRCIEKKVGCTAEIAYNPDTGKVIHPDEPPMPLHFCTPDYLHPRKKAFEAKLYEKAKTSSGPLRDIFDHLGGNEGE